MCVLVCSPFGCVMCGVSGLEYAYPQQVPEMDPYFDGVYVYGW